MTVLSANDCIVQFILVATLGLKVENKNKFKKPVQREANAVIQAVLHSGI